MSGQGCQFADQPVAAEEIELARRIINVALVAIDPVDERARGYGLRWHQAGRV